MQLKLAHMYEDEPFNPFNVGPPNSGARLEIKIPTCPTYPAPVYVKLPEPKEHTNRSVSQHSQPSVQAKQSKTSKSQIGEVAISKAINEEMAAAKQQVAAVNQQERIDAGAVSQIVPTTKSSESIKTLLSVRSRRTRHAKANDRSSSLSSMTSKLSNLSQASKTSQRNTRTCASKASKTEKAPSHLSVRSDASQIRDSTCTLKSKSEIRPSRKSFNIPLTPKPSEKETKQLDNISIKSIKSEKNKQEKISQKEDQAPKSLIEQAAEVTNRLKAGSGFNHKRFNATHIEPVKLSRDDRMSFWFSDAALS